MLSRDDIAKILKDAGPRVYSSQDMAAFVAEERASGRLPAHLTVGEFVRRAAQVQGFRRIEIASETYRGFIRFTFGNVSPYQIALSLRPGSYLSHGSAVYLHGLTDFVPARIYANKEQSPKPRGGHLTQEALTRAFSRPQRESNYVFTFEGNEVMIINGKNTGRLEVAPLSTQDGVAVDVTKLERTLIDIVVRPTYAGGVYQVLQAFEAAKARISTSVLVATLKRLDYVYPYHQAIGFYMECAGYSAKQVEKLRLLGSHFDFYLANDIASSDYDRNWRIFYPPGFKEAARSAINVK